MRRILACGLALVIFGGRWALDDIVLAQSEPLSPLFEGRIDGLYHPPLRDVLDYLITRGPQPLESRSGVTVGSAEVLSFSKDPKLLFLPTVMELHIDGQDYVVVDVVSQDQRVAFGFGYADSPTGPTNRFFLANTLTVPSPGEAGTILL